MADWWGREAALAKWREEREAVLDEERRFLFEERAAIIEFCGNLPRGEAERLARLEVYGDDVPPASV
jgi:hypothetical protein